MIGEVMHSLVVPVDRNPVIRAGIFRAERPAPGAVLPEAR